MDYEEQGNLPFGIDKLFPSVQFYWPVNLFRVLEIKAETAE